MVVVDHNKNIQRIIDTIKNDSSLFDNGKTTGLLRVVSFGDPNNNLAQTQNQIPYAFVTTASNMQETSPEIGVSVPDNVKSVTVEYQISIVSQSRARTTASQKQLYSLVKNMRVMTESNPTFSDPTSLGTDPVFTRSIISSVNWDEQTRGQLITIITMTLVATIGALFLLNIPGVSDPIPLISKPIDRDIDSIEDILDDTLIRKDTAPIKSTRTIFTEFETSSTVLSTLRSIKLSRALDSYTLTSPTGVEVIVAYLATIESSTGFSDMETTVIQLEVITP